MSNNECQSIFLRHFKTDIFQKHKKKSSNTYIVINIKQFVLPVDKWALLKGMLFVHIVILNK